MDQQYEIFLVGTPGLERPLFEEAQAMGLQEPMQISGGVTVKGGFHDVCRANLLLRGTTRVLVRIARFRAMHPAQLDKRARKVEWAGILRPDIPVKVEATSRKSRIYHAGAAQSRVARAISEELGAPISDDAKVVVKVRLDDDLCTISVDASGESLHKRGHKVTVNKAPMRETMAAMLLAECRYDGREPVYDPMCGSGTFPIEAAEIAAGLAPGRSRNFAFEHFANFDLKIWSDQKALAKPRPNDLAFYGSDRDAGAILMSNENAQRAGVDAACQFHCASISEISAPEGPKGLIMINPPYGGRIGKKNMLYGLYAGLGARLMAEFRGWRVGLVTTHPGLAKATGLPFGEPGPFIAHGGLKIRLWQTAKL